MATTFSMRSLFGALSIPTTTTLTRTTIRPAAPSPTPAAAALLLLHPRALSTTPRLSARMKKKEKPAKPQNQKKLDAAAAARVAARKRRAAQDAKLDPKVEGLMHFLYAPTQTAAPLRMARNRQLRHWTVHRAWQLLQRRRDEALQRELMQMQQSMSNACEALRNLEGPGTRPTGWLFRKSMEKVGVWGMQAVPIEYARPMVETPGERPWNHNWKRAGV
ncbi:unnamed protein product [Discula destructiva]